MVQVEQLADRIAYAKAMDPPCEPDFLDRLDDLHDEVMVQIEAMEAAFARGDALEADRIAGQILLRFDPPSSTFSADGATDIQLDCADCVIVERDGKRYWRLTRATLTMLRGARITDDFRAYIRYLPLGSLGEAHGDLGLSFRGMYMVGPNAWGSAYEGCYSPGLGPCPHRYNLKAFGNLEVPAWYEACSFSAPVPNAWNQLEVRFVGNTIDISQATGNVCHEELQYLGYFGDLQIDARSLLVDVIDVDWIPYGKAR